jgi:D-alanine-D-alanine ligase
MSSLRTRKNLIKSVFEHQTPTSLRLGVIYCTADNSVEGRELEKVADNEDGEIALAVKNALEEKGFRAELVNLDPNRVRDLAYFDHIFNLAESMVGFPLTADEVTERLENLNISFTGAGSASLKFCENKAATKKKLRKYGIPTPPYELVEFNAPIIGRLNYPLFVKPVHEDGSIGITEDSIVYTPSELASQIKRIHSTYSQPALVEEFIDGRDISISILGNGSEAVAFPPSECAYPEGMQTRFLTFATKWIAESIGYQIAYMRNPSELEPTIENSLKQLALQAYRIMGCRDYARVDFRLDGDKPYVLEVNPNPCINPNGSGFINATASAGYSFAGTIHRIVECSLKRRNRNFIEVNAVAGSHLWKSF